MNLHTLTDSDSSGTWIELYDEATGKLAARFFTPADEMPSTYYDTFAIMQAATIVEFDGKRTLTGD